MLPFPTHPVRPPVIREPNRVKGRRSAIEKRDMSEAPRVQTLTTSKGPSFPPGKMLIASPLEVQAIVMKVPKGQVLRMGELRRILSEKFNADYACPLTTGIFLRIVAEAAEEERAAGKKRIAPYWRIIKDDGSLNEKFPGGELAQAKVLKQEGHRIERKGKTHLRVMVNSDM